MLHPISSTEIREHLSEALNRVAFGHDRYVVKRQDKPVAAIVSMEDLELLEQIKAAENRIDLREAKRAIEDTSPKDIPLDEFYAELERRDAELGS
jgi:prevent-host-death family protein